MQQVLLSPELPLDLVAFDGLLSELTSIVVYEQFDGGRFQAASFC